MDNLSELTQSLKDVITVISTISTFSKKAKEAGASDDFTLQLNTSLVEMQKVVLEAQHLALEAQAREVSLNQQVAQLEVDLAQVREWAYLRTRYVLTQSHDGGDLVYSLRPEYDREEPTHSICPTCFDVRSYKVILVHDGVNALKCPRCRFVFVINP